MRKGTKQKKCAHDGKPIKDLEPYVAVHLGHGVNLVKLANLPAYASKLEDEQRLRTQAEQKARAQLMQSGVDPDLDRASLTRLTDKTVEQLRANPAKTEAEKA